MTRLGTDNQAPGAMPDHRQVMPIKAGGVLDMNYSGTSPKANWAAPLVIAW